MAQSEYDFLFKVPGVAPQPRFDSPLIARPATAAVRASEPLRRPAPAPQLLLIGDSGVGKSCLLLRFAVSAAGRRRRHRG